MAFSLNSPRRKRKKNDDKNFRDGVYPQANSSYHKYAFYQSIYMGKELQILPENYDLF